MTKPIRIASRSSKLALWQANTVGAMLKHEYEIVKVSTSGDERKDVPIVELGGIGAFAKEVQNALLNDVADIAVHSAKDLTSITPDCLELAAIPLRGDVRDVLIGSTLQELDYGARVGTGAGRRRAQLAMLRPDLRFEELRGNIETRIKKVMMGECDATLMAEAGLIRLGLTEYIKERFPLDYLTPPAGQGALAVITRKDSKLKALLNGLNHFTSFQEILAEKTVLRELGVGCQWPLGAIARSKNGKMNLYCVLLDKKGHILSKVTITGSINEAEELGKKAANHMEDYI